MLSFKSVLLLVALLCVSYCAAQNVSFTVELDNDMHFVYTTLNGAFIANLTYPRDQWGGFGIAAEGMTGHLIIAQGEGENVTVTDYDGFDFGHNVSAEQTTELVGSGSTADSVWVVFSTPFETLNITVNESYRAIFSHGAIVNGEPQQHDPSVPRNATIFIPFEEGTFPENETNTTDSSASDNSTASDNGTTPAPDATPAPVPSNSPSSASSNVFGYVLPAVLAFVIAVALAMPLA